MIVRPRDTIVGNSYVTQGYAFKCQELPCNTSLPWLPHIFFSSWVEVYQYMANLNCPSTCVVA